MQEGNKSLGILKIVQFGREIFTSTPVTYITADFKKLVNDLFRAGSAVLQSESIKRKTRLSIYPPNITIASKPLDMQYESTMQYISLTLHCKYPAKSLWDHCKLVPEEVKKTTESIKQ